MKIFTCNHSRGKFFTNCKYIFILIIFSTEFFNDVYITKYFKIQYR